MLKYQASHHIVVNRLEWDRTRLTKMMTCRKKERKYLFHRILVLKLIQYLYCHHVSFPSPDIEPTCPVLVLISTLSGGVHIAVQSYQSSLTLTFREDHTGSTPGLGPPLQSDRYWADREKKLTDSLHPALNLVQILHRIWKLLFQRPDQYKSLKLRITIVKQK